MSEQATGETTQTVGADGRILWDPAWNEETVRLAFDECAANQHAELDLMDKADTKVIAVFAVSSAIAGFAPALNWGALSTGARIAWYVAAVAWVTTAMCCYLAYKPRTVLFGPEPDTMLSREWLNITPAQYQCFALRDMGVKHVVNARVLSQKAARLSVALLAAGAEVLALTIAFLLR